MINFDYFSVVRRELSPTPSLPRAQPPRASAQLAGEHASAAQDAATQAQIAVTTAAQAAAAKVRGGPRGEYYRLGILLKRMMIFSI